MDRFNTEIVELEIPKVSCTTCVHGEEWCDTCINYSGWEPLNKCTCKHIEERMECVKCGYPYCEAAQGDDGTFCGCAFHTIGF